MMIVGIFVDNLICIESENVQELWESDVYLNIIIIEINQTILRAIWISLNWDLLKFPHRQMQFVQVAQYFLRTKQSSSKALAKIA